VWLKGGMRAHGWMCDDLVKRKILIGQTADETQRLPGQPDQTYASALSYKIDLGWPLKDPKHYGPYARRKAHCTGSENR
jgi:hypothetical protein